MERRGSKRVGKKERDNEEFSAQFSPRRRDSKRPRTNQKRTTKQVRRTPRNTPSNPSSPSSTSPRAIIPIPTNSPKTRNGSWSPVEVPAESISGVEPRGVLRESGQPPKDGSSVVDELTSETVAATPPPSSSFHTSAVEDVESKQPVTRVMDQTPNKDEQSRSAAGPSSEDVRSEFRSMAESRLQGILKSFGRVEELFNVGQSTGKRIKDIVENLNSQDMNKIRLATDDLNNLLNNTAEDAYSTFPIDQLMPALVNCMSFDEDVDVTLKAIRCLGTFARSLPSSCAAMVSHGAIPALCTRLLSMEVIDVAEESIRAIKHISKENPESCLMHGALCAVLSYLDFFSQHERRDAVESAAHMCRGLKSENCALVIDQVPTLVNLLGYEDAVLVEKAALALLRICEASVGNLEFLVSLSETQLVGKSMELISGISASPLKSSTFFGLIKILTLCAGNNAQIAEMLLINNISEILHSLLVTSTTGWRPGSNSTLIQTPEHLSLVLELTNSLLPRDSNPAGSTTENQNHQLTEIYINSPALMSKFGSDLLPVLLQVHDLTASQSVRASVLLIWSKVVKLIDEESFQSIVRNLRISGLLGLLLLSAQEEVVVQSMGLVEALMEKLPESFRSAFLKEGVVHAMAHLASGDSDGTSERALHFLELHFNGFSAEQDSEGVHQMKTIAMNLEAPEKTETALSKLIQLINEEGISTFEFLRSALVESLNLFLSINPTSESWLKGDYSTNEALSNVRQFVEIGLSSLTPNGSSPLQGLVHKLQESISACEAFPVRHIIRRHVRNPGPASKTGSDELKTQNLRLASLGQPLKLKLERSGDESELKELPQSQVLVEPLVIMQALEEYLWPKVKPTTEPANKPVASMEVDGNDQSTSNVRRDRPSVRRGGGIIHRPKFQTPPTKNSPSARLSGSPDDSEAMSFSHDESEEAEVYHEDDLILDDEDEDLDDELSDEDDDDDEDLDDEDEMEAMTRVHNLELNSEVDEMEETAPPSSSTGARASSSNTNERPYPGLSTLRTLTSSEIEFCIGEVVIKPQATIFQTIRESIAMKLGYEDELEGKQSKVSNFRHKWEDTHTITFRRRRSSLDSNPTALTTQEGGMTQGHASSSSRLNSVLDLLSKVSMPEELEVDDDLRQILLLMKMLDTINSVAMRFGRDKREIRPLSRTEFISSKLSTKLSQQIQDPLTVCSSSTPPWTKHLVISCKFLFPFELRRKFFYCRLGAPRALIFFNKEYEALGEKKDALKVERGDHGEVRLSKLKSMKVRVSRSKILSTAMKVMESYGHNTSDVIEVQYFNESGVGEGPTLEFYTLISQELQQRHLKMWRDEAEDGRLGDSAKNQETLLVHASKGLFPRPYPPGQVPPKVLRLFGFMGKTIARALIDGRLMDLNINPLFFRLLRNEHVDLYDIHSIDNHLGSSLEKLQEARETQREDLSIDGATLEDICLPFALPGYDDYPLSGGDQSSNAEFVNEGNLQSYINSVVAGTLLEGIEAQVKAFRDGFQSVLPLEMLEIFYDDELDLLLRGSQGCWTIEELSESVHFSHGYSPLCDQARWFLEILSELDDHQRGSFLQFLTGSPRLPPGGIGALSPKLTVVQRLNNAEGASENDLPSVATCVNFLKLPKYGSKEVMKDRLIIAFNEGQYAFDLS